MPVPQITTSHVVSERDSIIGINTKGKPLTEEHLGERRLVRSSWKIACGCLGGNHVG
jgi:hypothetical protein